jgi:O-acetyl-ADP-ribose deacetylase (regulator of RNase III)
MIKYVKGNLLDSPAVALVNTVNTVGVMGKGIALQFKQAYPHNFAVYKNACRIGQVEIGKILAVKDRDLILGDKLIINLPTKTHWRLPSEYGYIERGLIALRAYLIENDIKSLAMPAPGCGNGGLDWNLVKPILEKYLGGLDSRIDVYEPDYKIT